MPEGSDLELRIKSYSSPHNSDIRIIALGAKKKKKKNENKEKSEKKQIEQPPKILP